MPNDNMAEAYKEALASAPDDVVLIDTLEIRHSAFIDDDGNPTAIRVTNNKSDVIATLEASAPINAGEAVTFISFAFDFRRPDEDDKLNPVLLVSVDNAGLDAMENIQRAAKSREIIKVTYRAYLSNDLSAPSYDPPLHLTLTDISATVSKISGKGRFVNLANKSFPGVLYTPEKFRGLSR